MQSFRPIVCLIVFIFYEWIISSVLTVASFLVFLFLSFFFFLSLSVKTMNFLSLLKWNFEGFTSESSMNIFRAMIIWNSTEIFSVKHPSLFPLFLPYFSYWFSKRWPSCHWDLKYADCIPCKRRGVLNMTLNCVRSGKYGVFLHCHYSQAHFDLER